MADELNLTDYQESIIIIDFFGVLFLEKGINQELVKQVESLQGKKRFFVLSNMGRGGFNDHCPIEVQQLFQKCFLSGETGCQKPQKEAFEQVIDYAMAEPKNCLFIDDSLGNVNAAVDLGFNTFHYN